MIELIEEVEDPEIEGEGALEAAELSAPDRSGSVPFFKNWVWWVSLITAVPACFLLVSMIFSAIDYAAQWNWVMWIVAVATFFCAFAALVTPLLLALGFMLGGKPMAGPPMPVQAPESGEEAAFAEDDEVDDDESVDDLFDDDTDADENEFSAEFEDDDFDSDDDFEL